MKKLAMAAIVSVTVCACAGREGNFVDNVMMDFGLKDKPEGYKSQSDKAFENLRGVGDAEMKRMNLAEQHGTVKFQKVDELHGKYYKEVKVYESFYPLEAQPTNSAAQNERGFSGYIEYAYRLYQSARKDTSAEAEGLTADIPTEQTGRETYRYAFGAGGEWNGGKGDKVKK